MIRERAEVAVDRVRRPARRRVGAQAWPVEVEPEVKAPQEAKAPREAKAEPEAKAELEALQAKEEPAEPLEQVQRLARAGPVEQQTQGPTPEVRAA